MCTYLNHHGKKPYSDRGIRSMLEKYSKIAKMSHNVSPHQLRHFLFTWLKKKGIDDAPYSALFWSRKSPFSRGLLKIIFS